MTFYYAENIWLIIILIRDIRIITIIGEKSNGIEFFLLNGSSHFLTGSKTGSVKNLKNCRKVLVGDIK